MQPKHADYRIRSTTYEVTVVDLTELVGIYSTEVISAVVYLVVDLTELVGIYS